jgi:hypothetical protein
MGEQPTQRIPGAVRAAYHCIRTLLNYDVPPGFIVLTCDLSPSGRVRIERETAAKLRQAKAESALRGYEDDRDRECDTYLHARASYYGIERRWKQSVFWQRRIRAAA